MHLMQHKMGVLTVITSQKKYGVCAEAALLGLEIS
jgi:hypothetical protein